MKKQAFIYIIIAGMLWGTSGLFVHYLSPFGFSAIQMSCVRGIISFICMAVYVLLKDRSLFRVSVVEIIFFLFIGAALFGTASSYYSSMQLTSVSTAVILMYTAPVYVTVFSVLFLGEKMSFEKAVSAVMMLVGCCFVSGIIGGMKFDALGVTLGVLSGLIYAAYNIITKIVLGRKTSAVSTSLYSFLFMSIIALAVAKPAEIIEHVSIAPSKTVPLLIGLGICTFVLPYFLYTSAMKDISAGTASVLSVVEPMAATVFSVLFLNDGIDIFGNIGIVLILVAVVLLGVAEGKEDKANSEIAENEEIPSGEQSLVNQGEIK